MASDLPAHADDVDDVPDTCAIQDIRHETLNEQDLAIIEVSLPEETARRVISTLNRRGVIINELMLELLLRFVPPDPD